MGPNRLTKHPWLTWGVILACIISMICPFCFSHSTPRCLHPCFMGIQGSGDWGFLSFFCSSKLLFSYSSIIFLHAGSQGNTQGLWHLFSLHCMGKISGNHFSGYRQLPVDHLQFSCWCDMCITFSFSRQLHHVIWYIHNIYNVIHKTSCGISHTSIFTESQNTKTYL